MNKVRDKECANCTRDIIRVAKSKMVGLLRVSYIFYKAGLVHANNAKSMFNSIYNNSE